MSHVQQTYAFRLSPMMDLKQSIMEFARKNGIEAGYVITCVGSLQRAHLRYANQPNGTVLEDKYEIVSLTGTFSASHGGHFHMALSDGKGATIGGHVMDGNLVYTTAEIVIGALPDLQFARRVDSLTSYKELSVEPIK
jgi:uncharacterized protein